MNTETATPKVGDIHYAMLDGEFLPCEVTKISPSGKSFLCFNKEKQFGSYMYIPNREWRREPKLNEKKAKTAPLFK